MGLSQKSESDWPGNEARFVALWQRTLPPVAAVASTVYARLRTLYGESHRRYHSFNHIQRCLCAFDQVADGVANPDTIEMALWFHDAIYIPGAKDNEWRSAELFRGYAAACANSTFVQRVGELIMATTHAGIPDQADERFITDIDLCSFGLGWEQFAADGRQIRAECPQMSDQKYFAGLLRFLQGLLNRPTFFFTEHFEQRYGQIARANTLRLIEELQAHGYDGR